MRDIERVSPVFVREKVQTGNALLACAYDDDGKYWRLRLEGSIPLSEFKSAVSGIAKDNESAMSKFGVNVGQIILVIRKN